MIVGGALNRFHHLAIALTREMTAGRAQAFVEPLLNSLPRADWDRPDRRIIVFVAGPSEKSLESLFCKLSLQNAAAVRTFVNEFVVLLECLQEIYVFG